MSNLTTGFISVRTTENDGIWPQARRTALENGKFVVLDRMHLDELRWKYLIDVAKSANAPVRVIISIYQRK